MEKNIVAVESDLFNHDLIRFIPPSAASVIEIGCNNGALAAAYKRINPACDYFGVDVDAKALALAKKHCSAVKRMDIEAASDAFFASMADRTCWVFGDVLEHLRAPGTVLARIRKVIPAGGRVVACIPNMQNWRIQAQLAIGDLRYQDYGLLDRTHLRWFSRATMFELFQDAGFKVTGGCPRIFDEPGRDQVLPVIRKLAETLGANADLAVEDSLALQYILVAEPC